MNLGEPETRLALERAIQVVGEAARRVSPDTRDAHPEVPWRQIIAVRNILVHQYATVDLDTLWHITTQRLPELLRASHPRRRPAGSGLGLIRPACSQPRAHVELSGASAHVAHYAGGMELRDIARQRLASQGITAPRFESAAAVVGWLGAVQSQEYDVAKWSLGQRSRDETDASVELALDEGRILRTHALRPTWHFVLPEDIRWLLGLTAPLTRRTMSYYDASLGLDAALYARSTAVIVQALVDARHSLTRKELGAALAAAGIEASGQRLAHLMFDAELSGLVCSGPRRGKQHTYALLEERAPKAKQLPHDEALHELARRFFSSHGPATPRDFATWTGLSLTEARRALAMLGSEARSFEACGRTYWQAGELPEPPAEVPAAHLLQGYDEYIMGYSESRDVFGYGSFGKLPPGRRPLMHAVIVDGLVAGHWRRTVTPTALTVDLQLYRPLDAGEQEAIEAAIQRYGEFSGLPAAAGRIEMPAP